MTTMTSCIRHLDPLIRRVVFLGGFVRGDASHRLVTLTTMMTENDDDDDDDRDDRQRNHDICHQSPIETGGIWVKVNKDKKRIWGFETKRDKNGF